jgi:hypothetical protein
MAISNLLPAGGANDNRPNLKQFFGKSPTVANDNVERVSSGMFSNSFVDSVVTTLHSLVEEIAKITDIAKSVIASFGTIIKSLKNLNKDVTTRFRVLNNELNASRIDFIRTVLAIPKTEAPVRIDGMSVNIKQEETKKDGGGEDDGTSFIQKILELWLIKKLGDGALGLLKSLIDFAKGAMNTLIKFALETLPKLLALLEGAASPLANAARTLVFGPAAPILVAGAGFLALAAWAGRQRIENPEGWEQFLGKMRGAGERSKVITGPQAETEKFGPLKESGVVKPAQVLKANGLTKADVDTKNSTDDIVTIKDGRWFDTKSKSTELQPAETNPIINKGRPTQSTPAAPAGAPAGAPAATSSSGSGAPAALSTGMGTGGGNSAPVGSPAPATPAAPAGSNMGAPAGEVKQESNAIAPPPTGAPAGTAKTTSMGPPPSGPSGGEGVGSGGGVAVVQNSSVQNVGSVAGAETGGMTGQNLPMYSRNPKLQAAFERQVMRDHQ